MISGVGESGASLRFERMPGAGNPFSRIDQDGSGSADKAELETFATHLQEKTGRTMDVDTFIQRFDADGDGLISESEMPQPGQENGFPPPPGKGMPPPMGAGPTTSGEDSSTLLDMLQATEEEEEVSSILSSVERLVARYRDSPTVAPGLDLSA